MRDSEGHLFLVIFLTAILLSICVHADGAPAGFSCDPSCPDNYGEFTCASSIDSCEEGTLKYGLSLSSQNPVKTWYSGNSGSSADNNYPHEDYYSKNNIFDDYSSVHYYSCNSDTCGGYCQSSKNNEYPFQKRECQPWQDCINDHITKVGWPPYYQCSDTDRSPPNSYGCPGGEDGSTGCTCNEQYCQGWCADNMPVYDGPELTGCTSKTLSQSAYRDTICEKSLGGQCLASSNGKNVITTPFVSTFPCGSTSTACYISQSKCSDLGGSCMGYSQNALCTTSSGDGGWEMNLANGKFEDCPSDKQYCCVPVKTASANSNLMYDSKYTVIQNYHISPTQTAPATYGDFVREEQKIGGPGQCTGSDGIAGCEYEYSNQPKGGCYCNYLAIKDYYECDDAVIDDSHPCLNNNCAPDFVGGQSFCCPTGSCSHVKTNGDLKCLFGTNWGICDSYLSKDQTANPSVMCIPNGKEITYNGYRLTCDSGQWKTSQCGETLFNYPLKSNSQPHISEMLQNDPKYGFRYSPIAFYVNRDKPTDIIAYVIPKALGSSSASTTGGQRSVEISVKDSQGKAVTDPATTKEVLGDGTKQMKLSNVAGNYRVLFTGSSTETPYNISVDCYTPDKSYCDSVIPDCNPGSFCSEDAPTNIATSGEKVCTKYSSEESYLDTSVYPAVMSYHLVPKDIKSQNCFYCCPEGYCAHKMSTSSENVIVDKPETMAPLNPGDEVSLIAKDNQGNAATITQVNNENGESVCEFDNANVLKIPGGGIGNGCVYKTALLKAINGMEAGNGGVAQDAFKNAILTAVNAFTPGDCVPDSDVSAALDNINGGDAYRAAVYKFIKDMDMEGDFTKTVCKFVVKPTGSNNWFEVTIPVKAKADSTQSVSQPKAPSISPSTYGKWSVGTSMQFFAYDEQGNLIDPGSMINSGLSWSDGTDRVCKRGSSKEYGDYEAIGAGTCEISFEWKGKSAKFSQAIASADNKISIVVQKKEPAATDLQIECYPPGQQKLDRCSWTCNDGVWGKGGVGNVQCETNCDCNFPDENTYICTSTLDDAIKKICCEKGQCALQGACVEEGHRVMKGGVLQECRNGAWSGAGMVVKSDYSRTVLSKKNPEKNILLEIAKSEINTDKAVTLKAYHFFELPSKVKSVAISSDVSYSGNKNTVISPDNTIYSVSEVVELPVSGQFTVPLTYNASISIPNSGSLGDSDYVIYLGSSIVAEVVE